MQINPSHWNSNVQYFHSHFISFSFGHFWPEPPRRNFLLWLALYLCQSQIPKAWGRLTLSVQRVLRQEPSWHPHAQATEASVQHSVEISPEFYLNAFRIKPVGHTFYFILFYFMDLYLMSDPQELQLIKMLTTRGLFVTNSVKGTLWY